MALFEIFDPKARPRPIGIDLGTTNSLVAYVQQRAAGRDRRLRPGGARAERRARTAASGDVVVGAARRGAAPPSTRATPS